MPSTVLLAARFPERLKRELDARYDVLGPFDGPLPDVLPAQHAPRIRAVVTMGSLTTGRALMDALPELGLVCCYGSGYEGVDRKAAAERGIVVAHSPNANASAVADLAMGLVLASIRQIVAKDRFLRQGDWKGNAAQRLAVPRGLTGRRLGVYGLGAIGRKIAARAAAFEMEVAYHNRRPRPDVAYAYHGSLLSLADWADILVIAVRAGAATRHTVNSAVLRALGPSGHVINIARGSVIDEAALIEALEAGTIAGAGLDVFEHEPEVPERLKRMTGVVLTPHIGGATIEAHEAMQDMVLANLEAFFAGRPVPTPVPA